jgi:lipid-binding SYLF domain-containing protein
MLKRLAIVALLQIVLGSALRVTGFAQVPSLAPNASEIDQNVTAALRELYSHNEAAKALGAKAKGVLIFPDIKKAAFIVGAQYGYGALRKGAKTVGYYRTGAAFVWFPGWSKEIWLRLILHDRLGADLPRQQRRLGDRYRA